MSQVIYIDILFVINHFINYFLLLTVAKATKTYFTRLRLFFAAALGGAYSMIILLPDMPKIVTFLFQLIFATAIVFSAFRIKGLKHFFKLFASFFAVNFAFGGIMFAVWFFFKPEAMVYKNSAVYFDINLTYLIIMTIICYVIVLLISKLIRRNAPISHIFDLTISNNSKEVICKAILDTGNSLVDSFTGYPVIVVELNSIKEIITPEQYEFFKSGNFFELDSKIKGIHLIPYKSIGRQGVLPAFKPDFVRIKGVSCDENIENVYLAVCNEKLKQGEYEALLSNTLDINSKSNKLSIKKSGGIF
ncbi:MAG: sigma-E processing peptidase SpoIIGA [Clostridiales bacterium]|nr:sigma-E processing peptidase SpoIIGA [Clostridiales bacterium]